ncbi:MAG TPA: glycosyltransferase family 4 protein [Candidatus Handelsmanbacteria bacterium]|nr:glycosyltransferase family 4 protein [Candidatus Handelsmanbacteria bacterium]
MKNFKVCMLTTGFPRFQGDLFGTFVLELARELAAKGIGVDVLAPHEVGLARNEHFGRVGVFRFRYFFPTTRQAVAYGGGIPSNIRSSWAARLQVPFFLLGFCCGALLQVRRGDVVHCHWTISGLVAYVATRLWRRPLVLSVRGSDIHLVEHGLMAKLHRKIYGWMDVVVAVSEDIAEKLATVGVPRDKVRVVHNGVDHRFRPGDRLAVRRRLDLPAADFIALFVGLLIPIKGLDILVEALAKSQTGELLCLLVGDGPLVSQLQRQATCLGVGDRLRFVGRQPSDEIPAWMAAADVLVLPSRSEGRPNVVLEAQACGIPVVATAVGGTPELVRDGETGLLIEPDNSQALDAAIDRLRSDDALRDRLVEAGRAQAERLTWSASAEQMAEIYRDLLEAA